MKKDSLAEAADLALLDDLLSILAGAAAPAALCSRLLASLCRHLDLATASAWQFDARHGELSCLAAVPDGVAQRPRLDATGEYWQALRAACDTPDGAAGIAAKLAGFGVKARGTTLLPLGENALLILNAAATIRIPQRLPALLAVFARRLDDAPLPRPAAGPSSGDGEHFLRSLLNAIPAPVFYKDSDGRYLGVNTAFETFYGKGEAELVGKSVFDIAPADLARRYHEQDLALMASGGIQTYDSQVLDAGGRMHDVVFHKAPFADRSGRVSGLIGVVLDVTEHKSAEAALRESDAHSQRLANLLRMMCDNVPDMIWAKDLDNRYLFVNRAFSEQLLNAADTGEPIGRDDLFFARRERERHPENPLWHTFGELCQDSDGVTVARKEAGVFEESGRLKGVAVTLEVHKAPFRNDRGELIGTVGSGRDITDRKRIEAELETHRQHLEQLVQQRSAELLATEARASHILRSSADGLYGIDGAGRITFINPAACAMLGLIEAEVIGRSAHELFHDRRPDGSDYPEADCPAFHAVISGSTRRVDDEVFWHADGHVIPVMYAVHPLNADGESAGAVVSFVDISVQRAAVEAREQALIAAENVARLRREFLANVSHELRTPLNGVLGFAQIGLADENASARSRNAFASIQASGQRLLDVVSDLLDFSAIEAGRLRIEPVPMAVTDMLRQAIDRVANLAQARALDLRLEIAEDLPARCIGDPSRLGQILNKLLANAIKFTEAGFVRLNAGRRDDRLFFRVSDSGIGMDAGQLDRLFRPFEQADGSSRRRFGGSGLGLAISKRLLELMNGDIEVASEPGRGSRFEFSIPFVADPEPAAAASDGVATCSFGTGTARPDGRLAGLSILIAEDDPVSRILLEANMRHEGAQVFLANNGSEALSRVVGDGASAYDLVLMDLQMSELDGHETARQIRALAPDLPIIATTMHVVDAEIAECLAAGMQGHVVKPIDRDALVRLVRQLVRNDPAGTGVPPPARHDG